MIQSEYSFFFIANKIKKKTLLKMLVCVFPNPPINRFYGADVIPSGIFSGAEIEFDDEKGVPAAKAIIFHVCDSGKCSDDSSALMADRECASEKGNCCVIDGPIKSAARTKQLFREYRCVIYPKTELYSRAGVSFSEFTTKDIVPHIRFQ